MRVRLIIECEHGSIAPLLAVMPPTAVWHATRAPAVKAESPVRQMVMEAIQPPRLNKSGNQRGLYPKKRRKNQETRKFILNLLAQINVATRWSEIITAGREQHGWVKSRVSSALGALVKEGFVQKSNGDHTLTDKGREELSK